ncbi:hypothetical protein BH24ACT15_BH24ACT15_38550 [soil metagenome]
MADSGIPWITPEVLQTNWRTLLDNDCRRLMHDGDVVRITVDLSRESIERFVLAISRDTSLQVILGMNAKA